MESILNSESKIDDLVFSEDKLNIKLCKEACDVLGLSFENIDKQGYLIKVSNGEKFFHISINGFPPLNSTSVRSLAGDKVFTKLILAKSGLNVPNGSHFFISKKYDWSPESDGKVEAIEFSDKFGYPVFVKPHNQSQGRGAKICKNRGELSTHLEEVSTYSHIAMVEEVIKSDEHRLFVVDGEIQFYYGRKKADGVDIANIHAGGEVVNYQDKGFSEEIQRFIDKIIESFGDGLRVFAVDFFADNLDSPKDFIILEVNSQPGLSGIYELGKQEQTLAIWVKMLSLYFNKL